MPENSNGEGENKKPDVSEIASRWSKSAPQEPSEDLEPGVTEPTEEIDGDTVSYYGSGHIYLSAELQKEIGTLKWGSPIRLPAEYDEEAEKLIIGLEPVNDEDDDSEDNSETLASDGGYLSENDLSDLIDDLKEERGGSR